MSLIYVVYPPYVFRSGFSHTGSLHSPITFASNLPDNVPIVLVFGAQATRGIVAADHPYVRNCLILITFRIVELIDNHMYISIVHVSQMHRYLRWCPSLSIL